MRTLGAENVRTDFFLGKAAGQKKFPNASQKSPGSAASLLRVCLGQMRLNVIISHQADIVTLTQKGAPFRFDQTGLDQVKPEQSLHRSMAFSREILELERCLGPMEYGIIRTGYRIGMEPVLRTRSGSPQALSGSLPLCKNQAPVHATRTPSRVTAR